VWCGIVNDQVSDVVILENRLTGQTYLEFLQSTSLGLRRIFLWLHGLVCTFSLAVICFPLFLTFKMLM
jgi:hypothetical protein